MKVAAVREQSGVSIVQLAGTMSETDEKSWVEKVTALVDRAGARVVLDMGQVAYVNSAGLGELVRLTAQANTQGARLCLCNVTPFVQGVLSTTRLDKFFDVYPDAATAVAKFA